MIFFFDTSALIKRYIAENGSNKVDELFGGCDQIIVSPITKIEAYSTIKRLEIESNLSKEAYTTLCHEINSDFQYFTVLLLNRQIEESAISLINKYQLKALDALQLASVIEQKEVVQSFVVSDRKLKKAAISEKLSIIDPTDYD